MQIPATAMTGHLMWTRSGTIWATWRLEGLDKGLGNSEKSELSRLVHRVLFQSIIGESLLMGITADLDPATIVNSMLEGVDVREQPGWAEECLLTMDRLAERPLGKREYWLSVPLRPVSVKQQVFTVARHLETTSRELMALPMRPPSTAEIQAALQAAGKVEEVLPATLNPHRASVAEHVWIAVHAQSRGLRMDDPAPAASGPSLGGVAERYQFNHAPTTKHAAVFPEPVLDEGGQSDATKLARFNPATRRYLKVMGLREETVSYQVMLALASTPKDGWDTGLDWVGRLDELGVQADWAFRITTLKARDAKNRNARTEANLADQMDQQDGTAAITGSGGELDEVAQTLAEYHRALGSSEREVEIRATMIVAVGAETADEARDKAAFVVNDFKGIDFRFDIPLGAQEALWWAMQPGTPTDRVVRSYSEVTTGKNFASLTPISSSDLGDNQGFMFAENISSGTSRPVMLDLWGQIAGDISGSVGFAGEPGGGKSVDIKIIVGAVHDRGGRFVATDRTEAREYGTFAKSLDPKHTSIADLTEPVFSLDPLRIFGPRIGAGQMVTLCSALLGVQARSPEGVMLAKLLDPRTAVDEGLTSAGALLDRLEQIAQNNPAATNLAGLMGLYSATEYGAVLFDRDLPPLDLNSRGIVFLTHGVALPTKEEISNPSLFAEMPMDKLFGRAMYALLTRISREICFSRKNELTVAAYDEIEHITGSPQGAKEINTFLRDGRKHGAPVVMAGQDARDFGDEITRGLIKNRILTRQTDEDLAQANLEWFHKGFSHNPDLVQLVTEELSPIGPDNKVPLDRRGEALLRDASGRMGKIRSVVSPRPERAEATLSTPALVAVG